MVRGVDSSGSKVTKQPTDTSPPEQTRPTRSTTQDSTVDLPSRGVKRQSTASSFVRGLGFSRATTGSSEGGGSIMTSLTQRWTKMSPGAEAARRMHPTPEGTGAERVANALKMSAETDGAKVLLVGYSPTGGGHTARTLNIVRAAIESGQLGEGSTVVFSVPEAWGTRPKVPPQMVDLAQNMRDRGINVLAVGADKSVKGFLKPSGASDDPEIIRNNSNQPKRAPVRMGHIQEGAAYDGNDEVFHRDQTISGRDLVESMASVLGKDALENKVFLLSDMDPDLQKGGKQGGIPDKHRLEQSNHPIMLDLTSVEANLVPHKAILSKVLAGFGELVSYIGLGNKTNPINDAIKTADKLAITGETTKAEARTEVVRELLHKGRRAAPAEVLRKHEGEGAVRAEEGVLYHADVKDPEDVRNVIYVYAHGFQTAIGHHIQEQLNSDNPPEEYRNTMFVLCGPNAVKGSNAMHMGYVCDADAITTCGAGTNGEYAYLSKQAGAEASLLALPIKGHNEQETNADFLKADPVIGERVTVVKDFGGPRKTSIDESVKGDQGDLLRSTRPQPSVKDSGDPSKRAIDDYVKRCYEKAAGKYADGKDMGSIIAGMDNPNTYVKQAHDLLFGLAEPDAQTLRIMETQQAMRNDPGLKLTRKGVKVMEQVMEQAKHVFTMASHPGRIELRLAQKGRSHEFKNLQELYDKVFSSEAAFRHFLQNDQVDNSVRRMGSAAKQMVKSKGKEPAVEQFPLFSEVQALIKEAAGEKTSGKSSILGALQKERRGGRAAEKAPEKVPMAERFEALREKMGETMTTGF